MDLSKALAILLLFFSLAFTSPVFAGGGLVSFDVSPGGDVPVGFQSTIKPQVYGDYYGGTPCKKCSITIKIENPKSTDVVSQSDSKTDDNGNITAKFISQEVGDRIIYAEVTMSDGSLYTSSQYILHYINATPKGNISIQVISQKDLGGNSRKVGLSWNAAPDALDYFVSVRAVTTPSYGTAVVDTRSLSGEITINNSSDYFVKVSACTSFGICIESSEVRIAALKLENTPVPTKKPITTVAIPKVTPPVPTIKPVLTSPYVATPSPSQLVEPRKQQNFLQERINSVITWLKSILPFFK